MNEKYGKYEKFLMLLGSFSVFAQLNGDSLRITQGRWMLGGYDMFARVRKMQVGFSVFSGE